MKSNSEKFIERAFKIAREGIKQGQTPFEAVIVKGNKIIAEAHNTVWRDKDITAHAEINAIKKACKKLKTIDLTGCHIYSTCEPCPMCLSAIHWAKIEVIVFANTIGDSSEYGFNEILISNKTLKKLGHLQMFIISNFYRGEGLKLFEEFKEKKGKIY
jgi:tRNA(Arg) A34 adenosine deaminase TadA